MGKYIVAINGITTDWRSLVPGVHIAAVDAATQDEAVDIFCQNLSKLAVTPQYQHISEYISQDVISRIIGAQSVHSISEQASQLGHQDYDILKGKIQSFLNSNVQYANKYLQHVLLPSYRRKSIPTALLQELVYKWLTNKEYSPGIVAFEMGELETPLFPIESTSKTGRK